MVFDINGKVALVTGGASGIGLYYTKELLRNGARGVTMADINPSAGAEALDEIVTEFGAGKATFVQTDVTDRNQFEKAFRETVNTFQNIDVLINNAGILDDSIWEKQIAVNLNGTVNGILLAFESFFPKYKQGSEAVIINIASTAACDFYPNVPIYSATKAAVTALAKAWGVHHFYEKCNVRFVAICPGITLTPLIFDMKGRNLGKNYEDYFAAGLAKGSNHTQQPEHVGKEVMRIIKHAPNGSVWIIEGGKPTYEFVYPDRFTMKSNLLKTK